MSGRKWRDTPRETNKPAWNYRARRRIIADVFTETASLPRALYPSSLRLCRTVVGWPRNARVATRGKLGALSIVFPTQRFFGRLQQFAVDIGMSAGSLVPARDV